jgi:ribose 5-phosphate isomerase A
MKIEAAAAAAGAPGPALLRRDKEGRTFRTDSGNWILDAALQRIPDPRTLVEKLSVIPGVVEHGLFIGLAQVAILAGPGGVRVVER